MGGTVFNLKFFNVLEKFFFFIDLFIFSFACEILLKWHIVLLLENLIYYINFILQ